MEQNYIINLTNELINNLHSDISNTIYEDICFNNIPSQLLDISSRRLNFSSFSIIYPDNKIRSITLLDDYISKLFYILCYLN